MISPSLTSSCGGPIAAGLPRGSLGSAGIIAPGLRGVPVCWARFTASMNPGMLSYPSDAAKRRRIADGCVDRQVTFIAEVIRLVGNRSLEIDIEAECLEIRLSWVCILRCRPPSPSHTASPGAPQNFYYAPRPPASRGRKPVFPRRRWKPLLGRSAGCRLRCRGRWRSAREC